MTGKTVLVILIMIVLLAIVPAALCLAILALFERIGWRRGRLRVAVACLLGPLVVIEGIDLLFDKAHGQIGLVAAALFIAVLACLPTALVARHRRRRRESGAGLDDLFS